MIVFPSAPVLAGGMAAVLVSGFLRGFTGFGFALAATPLLSLLFRPEVAVPVVLMLQVGSSLVGVRQSIARQDRRSTRMLLAWAIVGTPIGVMALRLVDPRHARLAIAVACLAAAILLARGLRLAAAPGRAIGAAAGLCAGVLGGLCAMPGPPVLAFYMATPLPDRRARASMTLVFLGTGASAIILTAASGLLTIDLAARALLFAPAMIAGTLAGNFAFHRAPAGLYRPVGVISLAVIAALALAKALF